jgi:mitofusin 2
MNGWMDHALSAARVLSNDNLRRLIIPGIIVAGEFSYMFSPLNTY